VYTRLTSQSSFSKVVVLTTAEVLTPSLTLVATFDLSGSNTRMYTTASPTKDDLPRTPPVDYIHTDVQHTLMLAAWQAVNADREGVATAAAAPPLHVDSAGPNAAGKPVVASAAADAATAAGSPPSPAAAAADPEAAGEENAGREAGVGAAVDSAGPNAEKKPVVASAAAATATDAGSFTSPSAGTRGRQKRKAAAASGGGETDDQEGGMTLRPRDTKAVEIASTGKDKLIADQVKLKVLLCGHQKKDHGAKVSSHKVKGEIILHVQLTGDLEGSQAEVPLAELETFLDISNNCVGGKGSQYRALLPRITIPRGAGKRRCRINFGSQLALIDQKESMVSAGLVFKSSGEVLVAATPLSAVSQSKKKRAGVGIISKKVQLYTLSQVDEERTNALCAGDCAKGEADRKEALKGLYLLFPGFEVMPALEIAASSSDESEDEEEEEEQKEETVAPPAAKKVKRGNNQAPASATSAAATTPSSTASNSDVRKKGTSQNVRSKRRHHELSSSSNEDENSEDKRLPQHTTAPSTATSSDDLRMDTAGYSLNKPHRDARRDEKPEDKRVKRSRRTETTLEVLQNTLTVRWMLCCFKDTDI
jgi:hypothetical protein